MNRHKLNRRQFLQTSAALAGAAVLSPLARTSAAGEAVKRTAVDQVTLGKTGLKLSRLGFGTGSNSGREQFALGKEEFIKLIHYGYDQGITYIDAAKMYRTFGWIGDAIKGLPREKLFIQSKVPGQPDDVLAAIDEHRKTFNTDYVDSLLIHCMVKDKWTDEMKRVMDGFNQAKDKKWIRAKGVSCHSLPALRDGSGIGLARGPPGAGQSPGHCHGWSGHQLGLHGRPDIAPVMQEIKTMHDKGRGVIGMKLIGNGEFKDPADREKAIRFAMACKDIDAVVIGFTSRQQIDEAIERINRALAEV